MSSDNGYIVFKRNGQYHVTMYFASDEKTVLPERGEAVFEKLEEALQYATESYSEYGPSIDSSVYTL